MGRADAQTRRREDAQGTARIEGDPAGALSPWREVINHLSGLVGARVDVTLEVHAEVPEGIPEDRQKIVNENCRTLKFQSFGFEVE